MNKYLEKVAEIVEREELDKEAGVAGVAGWVAGKTSKALSGAKNYLKEDWKVTKARSAARTDARRNEFIKAKSDAKGSSVLSRDTTSTARPAAKPMGEVKAPFPEEGVGMKTRTFERTDANVKALKARKKDLVGVKGKDRATLKAEASQGSKKKYRLTYTDQV